MHDFRNDFPRILRLSPQGHIQNHHQCKSKSNPDRPNTGMFPCLGFGHQFLHHHINHCPGRKCQQIRQDGKHQPGEQDRKNCGYRFHGPGSRAAEKSPSSGHSFSPKRHGYNRPFREILYCNPHRQDQRPGHGYQRVSIHHPGKCDSDCHSLRNIMQGDCQDEHRRFFLKHPLLSCNASSA